MFKKKEKTEKAPKNKKVRTMKVGTHKKSVLLLWAVLLASTSFGVYKNFTAIDTHTVHEKEIIQLRLNDTSGIENFVKNFAKAYYSWDTSKEAIEARATEISKYLTKELQDLNADTIRTDIPTSATVTNVLVWNVKQSGTDDFTVAYEVDQQVKEGEQTQAVTENYRQKWVLFMRFVLNRKKRSIHRFGLFIFVYPLWGLCYFLLTIPSMPAPQTVKSSK